MHAILWVLILLLCNGLCAAARASSLPKVGSRGSKGRALSAGEAGGFQWHLPDDDEVRGPSSRACKNLIQRSKVVTEQVALPAPQSKIWITPRARSPGFPDLGFLHPRWRFLRYRGTSLIRPPPVGPYFRAKPRVLGVS